MGKLISIIVTVGIFAAVLIFGGAFYIVNESELPSSSPTARSK
jgi:hypothetical protein